MLERAREERETYLYPRFSTGHRIQKRNVKHNAFASQYGRVPYASDFLGLRRQP